MKTKRKLTPNVFIKKQRSKMPCGHHVRWQNLNDQCTLCIKPPKPEKVKKPKPEPKIEQEQETVIIPTGAIILEEGMGVIDIAKMYLAKRIKQVQQSYFMLFDDVWRPVSTNEIMIAANRVRKNLKLPQLGNNPKWMV